MHVFNLAKPTEYESSTQERRTNYTEMIALLSKKKKKKGFSQWILKLWIKMLLLKLLGLLSC